jgi:chromosome segregation ATPase
MNKGLLKNTIIVLLLTITVFSILKYKSVLNENYALLNDLNLTKDQALSLAKEKQNLLQDIEKRKGMEQALKANLRANRNKVTRLFAENNEIKQSADELRAEFSMLKAEKTALEEQKRQLSNENEDLIAKLNSLEELQLQIKELKEEKYKADNIEKGNKGYLTKYGSFTPPAKARIEVNPASQKE